MKTLNDFKQHVAEKYGFKDWEELLFFTGYNSDKYYDGVAEAYAEYRAKESLFNRAWQLEKAEKQGWNDALQWASKVIDGWPSRIITISEQQEEILKGLK